MNDATFDVNSFLQGETNQVLETNFVTIPENEYAAVISDVKAEIVKDKPVLRVEYEINDSAALAAVNLDRFTLNQTIWLDVANGVLQTGTNKNVGLGKLRAALGQNTGAPWKPLDMVGKTCKVKVKHTMSDDGTKTYANVKDVAAAA